MSFQSQIDYWKWNWNKNEQKIICSQLDLTSMSFHDLIECFHYFFTKYNLEWNYFIQMLISISRPFFFEKLDLIMKWPQLKLLFLILRWQLFYMLHFTTTAVTSTVAWDQWRVQCFSGKVSFFKLSSSTLKKLSDLEVKTIHFSNFYARIRVKHFSLRSNPRVLFLPEGSCCLVLWVS